MARRTNFGTISSHSMRMQMQTTTDTENSKKMELNAKGKKYEKNVVEMVKIVLKIVLCDA